MKHLHVIAPILALAVIHCGGSSDDDEAAAGGSLETHPEGPANAIDHPPVEPGKGPITSASPQRLKVQQLRQSFPIVMGKDGGGTDITWMVNTKKGLDDNADTLGEADYIIITEEILEPNPLYLKFMDDAARSVCDQTLTTDYAKAAMQDRVFLRYVDLIDTAASNAAGIDKTLRYLKLRFHAVKIADDDTTTIEPLRTLFQSTTLAWAAGDTPSDTDVMEGWRAVCVALLTAPEFHIY